MADVRTLGEVFLKGLEFRKPDRFLYKSEGAYRPISTEEFGDRVRRAAGALAARGVGPGDRVAILSYNRPEWAVVDYATLLLGAVSVPIYSTLPADQVEFILDDSGAVDVFVEDEAQLAKLKGRRAVCFGPAAGATSFEEFLRLGSPPSLEALRESVKKVDEESLATLIYTSGTTGVPKGVMLTHRNLVSNLLATCDAIPLTADDLALSFLPLSHSFERIVDYALYHGGASIAYAESLDTVPQNIGEVRPTVLAAVPRVYEKFHARIQEGIRAQPARRQGIFRWAISVGGLEAEYRRRGLPAPLGLRVRYFAARALVLRKIHARLGGRMRIFLSGGAPLAREIAEFFWAAGFTLLEGYGLTETSPVISVNRPGATKLGTVGKTIAGVEVKIAGDGEILCRGPNVMKGYFNRPQDTSGVIQDGWLATGDIGELDAEGYLRITDRKKDLLKTSGGKYIAPQPIENRLKLQPGVAGAVVFGDRRRFPAALLVPMPGASRDLLQKAVDEVNRTLAPHEQIKKFAVIERDFTIDGGELTPTMKVKRRVVEEKYKGVIDGLYAE